VGKRDPILVAAEAAVGQRVEPLLRSHGFTPVPTPDVIQGEDRYFGRVWSRRSKRSRPQFVDLSISVDPRDEPFFAGVSIGEANPASFLDREVHGLPLWELVERRRGVAANYAFTTPEDVQRVVSAVADDLATVAADFLAGDLSAYRRLRRSVPRFPRVGLAAGVAGQVALMPWRAVWWVLRGGPRRLREMERSVQDEEGEVTERAHR
jgi:hypothetical protein